VSRSSQKGAVARRQFSAEFKAEAVAMMRARRAQGVSLTHIARDLDVRANLLWAWAREHDGRGAGRARGGGGESLEEEVRRLRREVAVLRQEREFAKKAAAFFAKESL
jgi:transposase